MPTVIGNGVIDYSHNDTATITIDNIIDQQPYNYGAYVCYNTRTGEWEWEPFDKPKEAEIIWEV
jgi:hypothetical protein